MTRLTDDAKKELRNKLRERINGTKHRGTNHEPPPIPDSHRKMVDKLYTEGKCNKKMFNVMTPEEQLRCKQLEPPKKSMANDTLLISLATNTFENNHNPVLYTQDVITGESRVEFSMPLRKKIT